MLCEVFFTVLDFTPHVKSPQRQRVHKSQCSELHSSDDTKHITVGLLPVCKVDARTNRQRKTIAAVNIARQK